jgi:hypothetical protein
MKTFAQLFKYYRLRAGFASLAAFADALADKGYFYEDSIFSHWQKGTRTPRKRTVVVIIITIFIEHGGMTSSEEANEFLESAEHGYLTDNERESLFRTPFASATN